MLPYNPLFEDPKSMIVNELMIIRHVDYGNTSERSLSNKTANRLLVAPDDSQRKYSRETFTISKICATSGLYAGKDEIQSYFETNYGEELMWRFEETIYFGPLETYSITPHKESFSIDFSIVVLSKVPDPGPDFRLALR